MPLRSLVPIRERNRPIIFFKGTREEAADLTPQSFEEFFKRNQYAPPGFEFLRLKKAVIDAMNQLSASSSEGRTSVVFAPLGDNRHLPLAVTALKRGKVIKFFVRQYPLIHGVRGRVFENIGEPFRMPFGFHALKGILSDGFDPRSTHNVILPEPSLQKVQKDALTYANLKGYFNSVIPPETVGDSYVVRIMAPFKLDRGAPNVGQTPSNRITKVHIFFTTKLSPEEKDRKIKFYQTKLTGVPHVFHDPPDEK